MQQEGVIEINVTSANESNATTAETSAESESAQPEIIMETSHSVTR